MTPEEFARAQLLLPSRPGPCVRMADDWVTVKTGKSALSALGREIDSERDVEDWLTEAPGGLAAAMLNVARKIRAVPTKHPIAGDVGVIRHGERVCAAIHLGTCWFSRDNNGFIVAPLNASLMAWRI